MSCRLVVIAAEMFACVSGYRLEGSRFSGGHEAAVENDNPLNSTLVFIEEAQTVAPIIRLILLMGSELIREAIEQQKQGGNSAKGHIHLFLPIRLIRRKVYCDVDSDRVFGYYRINIMKETNRCHAVARGFKRFQSQHGGFSDPELAKLPSNNRKSKSYIATQGPSGSHRS